MQQTVSADWDQPFPIDEYLTRRKKVAQKLRSAGHDAILVTNPADLTYLTGYDMIWHHLRSLVSCLLVAETAEIVFFDYTGHETIVRTTPAIETIRWLPREEYQMVTAQIVDELRQVGLSGKRIAIQRWGYCPHADVMDYLIGKLIAADMVISDASTVVEEVRLVKTTRELVVMRETARLADAAMVAACDMLVPGVMETEIEATIMQSLMSQGCGYPGIRTMIGSGVRSGAHHSPPQHRRIGSNELVFIDFCASLHRYHVNLNRTFVVGAVDQRWHDLMDKAAQSIDHIVANIRPGDSWSRVQELGNENTAHHGIGDHVWFTGGYALGISMPPDWVGEHWITPAGGIRDRVLEPGLIFNLEGQYDGPAEWSGGTGVAFIETLMMTENGLEVMSELPRNLITA